MKVGFIDTSLAKRVYYPKIGETKAEYDKYRNPNGGYGGLLSVTFQSKAQAVAFFDALEIAKGPSLGTNFTLWLHIPTENLANHL